MNWSGLGLDSSVDIIHAFKKYKKGFIQGNFDESLLLQDEQECRKSIQQFLEKMEVVDKRGWVCGLGHGINKTTPEENVKLFVRLVREKYK